MVLYQRILLCFAMLLFICSSNFYAYSQTVFSVELISKAEFENAKSDFSLYNATIITPKEYNDKVYKVLQNVQKDFNLLPPSRQTEILEDFGEDFGFNLEQMWFIPDWNVYGFLLPTPFDATVWWYDGINGKDIGGSESTPTAVNMNRIFVSQIKYDCDWKLDLHFYRWNGEYLYDFASFSNSRFNGEYALMAEDDKGIFWGNDNTLYLHTYDYIAIQDCYLRIRIGIE